MGNFEKALDHLYIEFQAFFSSTNIRVLAAVLLTTCVAGGVVYLHRRVNRRRLAEIPVHIPVTEPEDTLETDLEHLRTFVVLSDVAKALTAVHDRRRLQVLILEKFHELFPFMEEILFFDVEDANSASRILAVKTQRGVVGRDLQTLRIPWREGLVGKACEQEMVIWRDELEDRFGRHVTALKSPVQHFNPWVAVPISLHSQFFGCVTLQGQPGVEYAGMRKLHRRILSILRDLSGLALANAQKVESLDLSNQKLSEQSKQLSDFNVNLRLKVKEQVAEMREQEHQLMQTEQLAIFGEFVATFAHDIKNPLAFIAGEAQWAQELLGDLDQQKPIDREGLRKSIEIIRKNSARVQDDIQSLVGRLKLPKLSREPTALLQLLEDLIFLVQRHAQSRGIEIHLKVPPRPIEIEAYAGLLRHALMNLISNSLAVMKSGDHLTVTLNGDDQKATISVEDTGPGIDPADLPKLFQLFHSRRQGGTGLGLYSVKRVIEKQHRGKVRVESSLGKGTRFDIELPLRVDTAAQGQTYEDDTL